MWVGRALVRLLARYTLFILVPLALIVWLVSAVRGVEFVDLLYKALLILTVGILVLVVLGGCGGMGGREWEAQMAGRLPGMSERRPQTRADMDVSLGFSVRLGIVGCYTGVIAAVVYALSH